MVIFLHNFNNKKLMKISSSKYTSILYNLVQLCMHIYIYKEREWNSSYINERLKRLIYLSSWPCGKSKCKSEKKGLIPTFRKENNVSEAHK